MRNRSSCACALSIRFATPLLSNVREIVFVDPVVVVLPFVTPSVSVVPLLSDTDWVKELLDVYDEKEPLEYPELLLKPNPSKLELLPEPLLYPEFVPLEEEELVELELETLLFTDWLKLDERLSLTASLSVSAYEAVTF